MMQTWTLPTTLLLIGAAFLALAVLGYLGERVRRLRRRREADAGRESRAQMERLGHWMEEVERQLETEGKEARALRNCRRIAGGGRLRWE